LADFGFSSDAHSRSLQTSASSKGTSGYRAPELLEDTGHYNAKVDIWALGCILYELASNKKAFPNDWAVFQATTSGSIPNIELDDTFDDNDKASIRNNVHSMLQIVPNSRPSAAELAKDFARKIESLRIASPPDVRVDQHFQMKARTVGLKVDAPPTIDDSLPPTNYVVPKIVAQSHFASTNTPDNLQVASLDIQVDAPKTIDDSLSPSNYVVPTTVAQGSDHSHFASTITPDNLQVASLSLSPTNYVVPTTVAQGSDHSHFTSKNTPDNVQVASLDTQAAAAIKSRNQRILNQRILVAAKNGNGDSLLLELDKVGGTGVVLGKDEHGRTALHYAAGRGHWGIVQLLLEISDAKVVAAKDSGGWTALHWAAMMGHEDIVRLLLGKMGKAEVDAKDQLGRSALRLATSSGRDKVVTLLRKWEQDHGGGRKRPWIFDRM
jgi:Protein kinase domain/Ankyrin repeats (3 copies)